MRTITAREVALAANRLGGSVVVPPHKVRTGPSESQIQITVINWWATACKGYGIPEFMLFSIPNGGWRDPKGAVFLKREGLRAGVTDLFLAVPKNGRCGMFIEMKRPDGVVSRAQADFMNAVFHRGYTAYVCYGIDDARGKIVEYLQ